MNENKHDDDSESSISKKNHTSTSTIHFEVHVKEDKMFKTCLIYQKAKFSKLFRQEKQENDYLYNRVGEAYETIVDSDDVEASQHVVADAVENNDDLDPDCEAE